MCNREEFIGSLKSEIFTVVIPLQETIQFIISFCFISYKKHVFIYNVLMCAIKLVELLVIIQIGKLLQKFFIVTDYNQLEILLMTRSQLDHSTTRIICV